MNLSNSGNDYPKSNPKPHSIVLDKRLHLLCFILRQVPLHPMDD